MSDQAVNSNGTLPEHIRELLSAEDLCLRDPLTTYRHLVWFRSAVRTRPADREG